MPFDNAWMVSTKSEPGQGGESGKLSLLIQWSEWTVIGKELPHNDKSKEPKSTYSWRLAWCVCGSG